MEGQSSPKVNKVLYSIPYGICSWMPYLENTFFAIFLTDVIRLSAVSMANLMSIGSTLIAISAIVSGILIQKGNSKIGKYRPWILYAGIAAGSFKYMMFSNPGFKTEIILVIWFLIGYVGSNFAFNLTMTSHIAMLPMIAHEPKERIKVSAIMQITGCIAGVIFSAFSVSLISILGAGVKSTGYSRLALIVGISVIAVMILLFKITKPVDVPQQYIISGENAVDITKVSILQMLKYTFINKPMILYLVGTTGKTAASLIIAMLVAYYYTYVAKDFSMLTVYLTVNTICGVIGSAIAPFISKIVKGNKNTFMCGLVIYVIFVVCAYFANANALLFTIFLSLAYIGWAVILSADLAVFSSVTDYVEYKKGKDLKGFMMAMWSFAIKFGIIIASATVGYGLAAIGYDPANVTLNAINGIRILITIIPIGYLLLSIVGMMFFPITDKKLIEMQSEIAKRKNLNIVKK